MKDRSELLSNLAIVAVAVAACAIWWEQAKGFVVFAVTLGILVFIHEWGHFQAARAVGVHCYEFALGMGPKLMTYWRRGGTEYTIRLLPLGGFVNIKGMQPDDPITPDGLNGRRPAERALVYLAGPLMNMILFIVVLMFQSAVIGVPNEKVWIVGPVSQKSAAKKVEVVSKNGQPVTNYRRGLEAGDYILAINDEPVSELSTIFKHIHANADKEIRIKVRRGADELMLKGVPPARHVEGSFVTVSRVADPASSPLKVGDQIDKIDKSLVGGDAESLEAVRKKLQEKAGQRVSLVIWRDGKERIEVDGLAPAVELEVREGKRTVGQFGFQPVQGQNPPVSLARSLELGTQGVQSAFLQLASLFDRGGKQLGESLGGPVAIYSLLSEVSRLPLLYYFSFLASLSLSLAVFNLVPIPVLDGGHMLLLAVEVLRRRRLEPDAQKIVQLCGLAIIGVLFITIMWKDITKHF